MSTKHYLLALTLICASNSYAQTQNLESIKEIAREFLSKNSASFGEAAVIEVGNIDSRLKLTNCDDPAAFLPPGSKAWGKVTVGIRCSRPKPWQVYLSAQVRISGEYYVAASNLVNGQILAPSDIIKVNGELSNLPANAITKPQLVLGKTIQGSYAAGIALRSDMFRSLPVVQQGQTVKVVSYGKGFTVSTEATALTNANEGQVTKVKTNNGQLIAGIAKLGGIIEIQN